MAAAPAMRLHGSCVLVGTRGVLVRGGAGSGKSTVVLDLLTHDAPERAVRLVADDAVDIISAGGRLVACAPPPTFGLLEARWVGLATVAAERRAVVGLVIDLLAERDTERLPEPDQCWTELAGARLPRLALPADRAGNALRILTAVRALCAGEWPPGGPASGGPPSRIRT
jgi:HPr kinase/phosphorylase